MSALTPHPAAPTDRAAAVREVARWILDRPAPPGPQGPRPRLVGITGMDASGKTRLAHELAELVVGETTRPVQVVHVDDFHNPRAVRYDPALPEWRQYYERSFDLDRLVGDVLAPIRTDGRLRRTLRVLDLATDRFDAERTYEVGPTTVVLVEGVFLLRDEVRPWLDDIIHLEVSEAAVLDRARARDAAHLGADLERRYREKYLPAQRRHLARFPPERHADVIIDNDDLSAPRSRWVVAP